MRGFSRSPSPFASLGERRKSGAFNLSHTQHGQHLSANRWMKAISSESCAVRSLKVFSDSVKSVWWHYWGKIFPFPTSWSMFCLKTTQKKIVPALAVRTKWPPNPTIFLHALRFIASPKAQSSGSAKWRYNPQFQCNWSNFTDYQ